MLFDVRSPDSEIPPGLLSEETVKALRELVTWAAEDPSSVRLIAVSATPIAPDDRAATDLQNPRTAGTSDCVKDSIFVRKVVSPKRSRGRRWPAAPGARTDAFF
jgi:hypothetical protein